MIKRLVRHGNSTALIIDKAVLQLLNLTLDTPLQITTDGTNLLISPVRSRARQRKVKRALASVNLRHGEALRHLAE